MERNFFSLSPSPGEEGPALAAGGLGLVSQEAVHQSNDSIRYEKANWIETGMKGWDENARRLGRDFGQNILGTTAAAAPAAARGKECLVLQCGVIWEVANGGVSTD